MIEKIGFKYFSPFGHFLPSPISDRSVLKIKPLSHLCNKVQLVSLPGKENSRESFPPKGLRLIKAERMMNKLLAGFGEIK
tara:strand:+ start:223 stop:462 length:240 start_codon:yes stop_codon:yes gene_type:complete